jgi:hypothetical protein
MERRFSRLLAAVEDGVKRFAYNARRFGFGVRRPRSPAGLLIANRLPYPANRLITR